ncbi:MAG TPA: FGGY family carbohydrate kinase, partial [Candidatus Acidoferrum sp.]|nr:FGGY family carbohydrate kinase [Candidatus Acidoferrum sp.]
MKTVLAIDEGTTGSRALVIAEDGRVLGRGYREVPQHFPQPGWVEHDPEDLLRASLDACREALTQAKTRPDCIGITNQRETVCVWNRKTGKPLSRAIVWQDRRTADR